jgi:hypothetical protein
MNKYAYQIQGAIESTEGKLKGFRVFVCTNYNFGIVDVPSNILDRKTISYLQFRLKVYKKLNMKTLPATVQSDIRMPLGRWLDNWVLELIYGNTGESKDINTGLLEDGA